MTVNGHRDCISDTRTRQIVLGPQLLDMSQDCRANFYRRPTCGHVWTTSKEP